MTHETPGKPNPPHTPGPELRALNFVLGSIAFAIAASMAGAALRLAGVQTMVGIVAAVLTATAFLILWNLRLHRQPYGLFLCASLLSLGGAMVALAHALYVGDFFRLQHRFAAQPQVLTSSSMQPAVSTNRPVSPASAPPVAMATPAETAPAEPEAAPTPKPLEWTAEWRESQAEAVRRYPALGVRASAENKTFVAAFQSLRRTNPAYFEDPEWPLHLAQALAERDGWARGDGIIEDQPMEPSPASPDTPDSGSEVR